jgi:hypothetical protein
MRFQYHDSLVHRQDGTKLIYWMLDVAIEVVLSIRTK